MILAHKIALDPAPEQAVYFARAAGTARFAWNSALGRWQEEYALWKEYQCGPKPSEAFLRRALNALKEDAFPWMQEVTKNAPQQAIKNPGAAFKNFFEGRAKYPRFKTKGLSHAECGFIYTSLALSDREWTCNDCGVVHDRDHNAAINLMNMAGSSSVTACGAGRAGLGLAVKTKQTVAKQESTHGMFVHV